MSEKGLISELYESQYKSLVRFAQGYTTSHQSAEELVQDLFVRLLTNNYDLGEKDNAVSYLYKAVRNAAIDYNRRYQAETRAIDTMVIHEEAASMLPSFEVEDIIIEDEIISTLHDALQNLTDRERDIYCDVHLNGKSQSQLVREQNTTGYHIRKSIQHSRYTLKNHLSRQGIERIDDFLE